MYNLICTSYNEQQDGSLQLRINWIEYNFTDEQLLELIDMWSLPKDFPYPSKGSISNILVGKMKIDNVVIHVRIVRF